MKREMFAAVCVVLASWALTSGSSGCAGPERGGEAAKQAAGERPLSQRTDAELKEMMLHARGGVSPAPAPTPETPARPEESPPEPGAASTPEESDPPRETTSQSQPPEAAKGAGVDHAAVKPADSSRSPARIDDEVKSYVRRLRASPDAAGDAFRELWEVDSKLIPDLILEVENREPSQLRELKILVADRAKFARQHVGLDPKGESFVYELPGMGLLDYDDIASGPTRGGKSLKVVLKRFDRSRAFTVGEVIRAALANRFRSSDYPAGDHRNDLVGWWQRYYQKIRSEL